MTLPDLYPTLLVVLVLCVIGGIRKEHEKQERRRQRVLGRMRRYGGR